MREIDALDRALARAGQNNTTVTLRCLPTTDVTCNATVRGYAANELSEGITQQDSHVIISPTPLNTAVWPSAVVPGAVDPRIPSKNRGDICIINNKPRYVQSGVGIYIGATLVRIELQVR